VSRYKIGLTFIRNYDECKKTIQELIDSNYTREEISDFLMRKFLKSFRAEYNFVFSNIEKRIKGSEDVVISIVEEPFKNPLKNPLILSLSKHLKSILFLRIK
jgi:hypothetical protein